MDQKKDTLAIAAGIVKFLDSQQKGFSMLSASDKEALQVAATCIQKTFSLSTQAIKSAPSLKLDTDNDNASKTPNVTNEQKEQAEMFKKQGNEALQKSDAVAAASAYTQAIELDCTNPIYFSNRAAAWTLQKEYESAIEDCLSAISLDPNYAKAFGRLGAAYAAVGKKEDAAEAFRKASDLDPSNESYKAAALEQRKTATSPQPTSTSAPGAGGMDFASLLNNPQMMQMASQMMNDPNAMQNLMNNPQLRSMFGGMMGGTNSDGDGNQSLEDDLKDPSKNQNNSHYS